MGFQSQRFQDNEPVQVRAEMADGRVYFARFRDLGQSAVDRAWESEFTFCDEVLLSRCFPSLNFEVSGERLDHDIKELSVWLRARSVIRFTGVDPIGRTIFDVHLDEL